MTVLTFPTSPTLGQQYAAPNGIQYVFDGVKWIVETVASTSLAVTNSVQDRVAPMFVNGDNTGITFTYNAATNVISADVTAVNGDTLINGVRTLKLESNGNITAPAFTIPNTAGTSGQVLKWPSSGSTLAWGSDNNTTDRLFNDPYAVTLNSDGSITLPTKTTLDFTRRDLVGPTLQMGNDPTVSDAVITGPAPNLANPNAVRLIIQGQEGFELPQAGGAEGGDVYIWAGHGGEGDSYSGNGGDVKLRGGIGGLDGGYIRLESGDANAPSGTGGFLDLNAGNATNSNAPGGTGGSVNIRAGSGTLTSGTVNITTNNNQWVFAPNGALSYPNVAIQRDTATVACPGNASTVVYTALGQYQHAIKLFIQVEGSAPGDPFDTQACEMIIAKSFRANDIAATVYGIVHTSVAPLATFTALWNGLTNRVEVVCTTPNANTVNVRTFATEITTSD